MTPGTAIKVLIADDDQALLESLSEALRLRFVGIAVDTFESAVLALDQAERVDYDCIISDIKMPGMSGIDLLERLHSSVSQVPVLLITGHGETDLAIQALRAGAFDLIQKPLDRDYLVAALNRAIEVRSLRRELALKHAALEEYAANLEQRVEERTQDLEKALRAKDEFLGLMSHELRTPVAVIFGYIEVLAKRIQTMDEADRIVAIQDVRQETRRLLRIIENLLILARVEHGIKPEELPLAVNKVIQGQLERNRHASPDRQFLVDLPEPSPIGLFDATHFELILTNLISNAEKYSDGEIAVEVEAEGCDITVSVLDRGVGIRPEEQNLIFAPFYRSEVTASRSGMGIGLAVCRHLLELHGGTIWAEPRPGGGTAIRFSLRAAIVEPAGIAQESSPSRPDTSDPVGT